jgi:hypothetical protein
MRRRKNGTTPTSPEPNNSTVLGSGVGSGVTVNPEFPSDRLLETLIAWAEYTPVAGGPSNDEITSRVPRTVLLTGASEPLNATVTFGMVGSSVGLWKIGVGPLNWEDTDPEIARAEGVYVAD